MPRKKSRINKNIDLLNPNTFVVCAVCGEIFENLTQHINSRHGLSGKDYKDTYGGVLRSVCASERHAASMKEFLSTDSAKQYWSEIQHKQLKRFSYEEICAKWGRPGNQHGLWGKHHSYESLAKNSQNNKIASIKLKEELISNGLWDSFVESRIHRGKDNGMYGKTPPKGSGRCHYYQYISSVSGKTFLLQGSYEVRMAVIFDKLRCCWEKTKDRFEYTYNGISRTYNPDFKVIKSGNRVFYYETKGYINEEALVKFQAMDRLRLNFIVVTKEVLKRYERHLGIR